MSEHDVETLPALAGEENNEPLSPDLASALYRLPAEQQKILDMRLFEDLSFQEISRRTGKSEVSLRKGYSRAVQNMRDWIGAPKGGSK